jgi:hypothetical protein
MSDPGDEMTLTNKAAATVKTLLHFIFSNAQSAE